MRRLLADLLVPLGASLVILLIVALGGTYLVPRLAGPLGSAANEAGTCDSEPLLTVVGAVIRGHTQLCIDDEGSEVTLNLEGLTHSNLYSAWVAFVMRPATFRGPACSGPGTFISDARATPGRVDSAVTDQTGGARMLGSYRGIRLNAGWDVWVYVIEHGARDARDPAVRVRSLVSWQHGWWDTAAVPVGEDPDIGRLTGCARFQRKGGVESLE
jgi:hypothetical protein